MAEGNKKNEVEILLVEDNKADAEVIISAFSMYKVIESGKVHVVNDGADALRYIFGSNDEKKVFLNHCPSLIILDLKFSESHGLDVLKKIKKHKLARNIPIVILTSSDKKTDWLDAYSLGADTYLCKSGELGQIIEIAGWAILEDTSISYQ